MEASNKRLKSSHPGDLPAQTEFVSLDVDDGNKFGYGNEETNSVQGTSHGLREHHHNHTRDPRFDRRNAQDHPVSKHQLPGHEPWILVKTKFSRRFVHNPQTRESFWRVPADIWPAVKEFEASEAAQKEKEKNAKWAEEELKKMRSGEGGVEGDRNGGKVHGQGVGSGSNAVEVRNRRRRSESLQREDEEDMMAELAAEAAPASADEGGAGKDVLKTVEPEAGDVGYDTEGTYEYVEVTDDEGEEGDAVRSKEVPPNGGEIDEDERFDEPPQEDVPVEFTEDDIAHQLAAMGAAYGLDEGEYGSEPEEGWDEGAEGLEISDDDAANLFRELLDDSRISPFTPWEKIIADESERSIMNDDRYTVLPTMKARREVFDVWVRDKAAQIKEQRAKQEKLDPRIPYLAFLAEKATPKLYWPEFKRKFKKEAEMSDRKMLDKDRERLYREHINRLKLPESTRKADLLLLLRSVPLHVLHKDSPSNVEALPNQVRAHLHSISLPKSIREAVVAQHVRGLPSAPEDGQVIDDEGSATDEVKARRQMDALAARREQVEQERWKAEKEARGARRELVEGEREVERWR